MTDVAVALLAVGTAATAHVALRRIARRVPRWLAARRGVHTGGGRAPGDVAVAFGCFVGRALVWLLVFRVLAARYRVLDGLRDRAERILGMSFGTPLFALGMRSYSLADLLTLLALLALVWGGVAMVTHAVRTHVLGLTRADRGVQDAVAALVRYALSALGTIVLLQAWGIDMSSLTIVASVLGVGLGFGMQNIANNFVSGLLLTMERPIKPGDFVQLGDLTGTVERIGARSTEIRTLDSVAILVPNSRLLEHEVVNWSHGDPMSRIHVPVSIEYGGDLRRARAAMLEAARAHAEVLDDPRPSVELRAFGESGIELELLVWTREPRRQSRLRSDLGFRILAAFERHGITIPFAQQDVHVHAPALERAVTAWARRQFGERELAAAEPATAPAEPLPDLPDEPTRAAWTEADVLGLVAAMRGPDGVAIEDRRHLFSVYPRCFVGSEAVAWLRRHAALTGDEAIAFGRELVARRIVHHVLDEHDFEDGPFFYRFYADEPAARSASAVA